MKIMERDRRALPAARAGVAFHAVAVLAAVGLCASAAPAQSSSAGATEEPATLTLHTGPVSADGSVRGALSIDLDEGWKTYWIDPGASGIAPTIDVSSTDGAATVDLLAPLPERFGEGLARSNGYEGDVALPFVIRPADGETIGEPVVAEIFLGVCDEICVPVHARLTATEDAKAVDAAFAALPRPLGPSAVTGRIEEKDLVLSVSGVTPISDAYVLGPTGWYFGEPGKGRTTPGGTTFRVPIDMRPDAGPTPTFTVVLDDGKTGLEASVVPR